MSEQPIDYYPGPKAFWKVNTCNKVPPFFDEGSRFTIRPSIDDSFILVLEFGTTKLQVPLSYSFENLFMNARGFSLPGDPRVEYWINFKLAPPISVGRTTRTLYCTVETRSQIGASEGGVGGQDSEQGVFGAEEDGGGSTKEESQVPPAP